MAAKAVKETAAWTSAKIRAARVMLKDTIDDVRRQEPSIYSREPVDQVFIQPYCRIGNLVDVWSTTQSHYSR